MNLAGRCGAAIRRTGETARLLREGERIPFPASVQPVRPQGPEEMHVAGAGEPERFTLYACCGGAADGVRRGDVILWRGERYRVLRKRTLTAAGEAVYHWAVLRRDNGACPGSGEGGGEEAAAWAR